MVVCLIPQWPALAREAMQGLKQTIAEAVGRGDFAAAEVGCETMTKLGEVGEATHLRGVLRLAQGEACEAIVIPRKTPTYWGISQFGAPYLGGRGAM